MKIALITCVFPPYNGGMANVAFNFSRLSAANGNEVTVYTPDYNKKYESFKGFEVFYLKPFLKYGNAALLLQLIFKLRKYDIVYLQYPFFGGAEVVWFLKLMRAKFKLFIHYHMDTDDLGLFAKIFSLPSVLILKSLFKQADAVTCATFDYIKNSRIKDIYFKSKDKFYEIPFGVDLDEFKPREKEWNKNEKVILFVGGLDKAHYFKGIPVLLNAAKKIKNKNFKLKIVGDGELRSEYIKISKELLIDDKVEFLNNISNSELPEIYRSADLFVLPSINNHEAFGIVLLEAMASGVPVLASNLPGVRSVFLDGVHGMLVEPNNVNDLSQKIELLISDEEKLKLMGENAYVLVREKYDWNVIGRKLNHLYVKVNENLPSK